MTVIIEIFLSKNISGFELRYYFHWLLLIPLILILPLGIVNRLKTRNIPLKPILFMIYIVILILTVGPVVKKNINRLYEGDFVYGYVRNYATRRINLDQWLDYYYPEMSEFIRWCGKKGPMKDILLIDPELIWISNESYMKAFMVNCKLITHVSDDYTQTSKLILSIKEKYKDAYIASLERCDKNKSYQGINTDPYIVSRYEANQQVICKSSAVLKNLYRLSN